MAVVDADNVVLLPRHAYVYSDAVNKDIESYL